jgi:UDP-2-acetamido-3-amino-2,3-dideoxy-glucuronate N-acetyltransferase
MSDVLIHPQALCESRHVGQGTRIWAFAHVLPGARIGSHCNICDSVFIENDVVVGDRVTVKCGVQLWDGVRLGDDVFIGPNATFANDKFPRSRRYHERFPETIVRNGASLGANCTILPGLQIGRQAMIGAGSVVTGDVPPFAIVTGNPARITGYVDSSDGKMRPSVTAEADLPSTLTTILPGVALHRLREAEDLRGMMSAVEVGPDIPFDVKRFFATYDVPSKDVRGERAHLVCEQFLICIRGSVALVVDDGQQRVELMLDRPGLGVHVRPMIWTILYRHTPEAVVLTFASDHYDPADYIRDYEEFIRLLGTAHRS